MKQIMFIGLMLVLPLSAMAAASDSGKDTLTYKCDGFKNGQGERMLGSQVAIVSKINDLTGAKEILVRTAAVVPQPVFRYEVLTKVSQFVDGSQYESENYKVDFMFFGKAHAHIQQKGSL